jgi:outer membrane lipoprotein-sorting protein
VRAVSALASALGSAFLAVAAAAVAPATATASEAAGLPEPTLEALMRGMATSSGVSARFHEAKQLALLSVPLEVRGMIYFVPPDRLLRITSEPSRSRLVIDGSRFAYRDEAGGEQVDLSGNPLAREFVTNFVVLFNGDLAGLRQRYEPALSVEGQRWKLVLRARQRPLADIVDRVTLEGSGRTLDRMEMLETNGDRTTTTFEEVQTDRHWSGEELERLFSTRGSVTGEP